MIGGSRIHAARMLAAVLAVGAGSRMSVLGGDRDAPPPPHTDLVGDGVHVIDHVGAPVPGMVERVKRWLNDDPRRAAAGKPWKRGGRHTIKQRRALAFAANRRT